MPRHYAFADYTAGRQPSDAALAQWGVRRFGEGRSVPARARVPILSYSEWHPGRDGEPFEILDAPTLREGLERLRRALDPDAEIIQSYSA